MLAGLYITPKGLTVARKRFSTKRCPKRSAKQLPTKSIRSAGCISKSAFAISTSVLNCIFLLSLLHLHYYTYYNKEYKDAIPYISHRLGLAERSGMEVEHHRMLARLHLKGTENIVHTSQFCGLSVDSGCPSGIIDLREHHDSTLVGVDLVDQIVGFVLCQSDNRCIVLRNTLSQLLLELASATAS